MTDAPARRPRTDFCAECGVELPEYVIGLGEYLCNECYGVACSRSDPDEGGDDDGDGD
jgi:hypothetical protein